MSRFLKALKFWRRHEEKVKEEDSGQSHHHHRKKHGKKHRHDSDDEEKQQQHEDTATAAADNTGTNDATDAAATTNDSAAATNETELIGGGPAEGRRSYLDSSEDEKKAAAAAGEAHVASAPYVEEVIRVRDEDADPSTSTYAYLSPFHHRPTIIAGNEWPTLEHYIQSLRCTSDEWRDQVRAAETPEQARELGRTVVDRDDENESFEAKAPQLLQDALKAKFMQHPDLQEQLLATQVHVIYISSDEFLGQGEDGEGDNTYGKAIEAVRNDVRLLKLKMALKAGTPLTF